MITTETYSEHRPFPLLSGNYSSVGGTSSGGPGDEVKENHFDTLNNEAPSFFVNDSTYPVVWLKVWKLLN